MPTFHEEAGKGDFRRKEDRKTIESNWDKIDWSKKVEKKEDSGLIENNSGCSNASESVPDGE